MEEILGKGVNKKMAAYYLNYMIENAGEVLNKGETIYLSGGLKYNAYKVTIG